MKPDFAFVLDQAAWPVFLVDDSGMVRISNATAVTMLGRVMEGEPALAASIWSHENELTAEEFLAHLERSSNQTNTLYFRVKGGSQQSFTTQVCPFLTDGKKYHLFQLFPGSLPPSPEAIEETAPGTAETLSRGMEASAAQKQKLDCAMQLIRTVALDFNNALTTILGHTSLVLSKMEPTHAWRHSLLQVEKSAERAAEISADLGDFSRQEKDNRSHAPGNLNEVLRRAVELFQKPEASHILWSFQMEKRLFTVVFDEAKLQQAFVRVLENAVEAVGRDGRITVRTLNQSLEEPVISPTLQLPAGHYVGLEITDNGGGIRSEVLPRVFEPFFTTKDDPRHRGLGLAWVYGIITNHGGVVSVTSPPGQGTTVRIYLPAEQRIVRDQGTQVDDLRGSQTVLFVDDEELLLNLGQTVLSTFGYKVITASNGHRALELFGQGPGQIDLVVTDLVMPGMSGRELIDQLRRISRTVPILSTSGYLRGSADEQDENYLRKPFTSQELLRKVKQMLASGARTSAK